MHAAVYLGDCERDQVSESTRDRSGILEYLIVQLLGPRGRIAKIVEKVNNLNFDVRPIIFLNNWNRY